MEGLPAVIEPVPPEANADFVHAFMAANQQELKDVLYESCEHAVQRIAHRTLSIYLQSRSPTAESGNGHAPYDSGNVRPVHQAGQRPKRFEARVKAEGRLQAVGTINLDQSLATNSAALKFMPRRDCLFSADMPKKKSLSPDTEPLIMDELEGNKSIGLDPVASHKARASSRSKTKAHIKRSMLSATPIGSSANRRTTNRGAREKQMCAQQLSLTLGRTNFQSRKQSGKVALLNTRQSIAGPAQGIFANADDMKEKLRAALTETPYDVMNFYSEEGWCQAIARSSTMENITLAVIGLNAFWISIDVDLNDATIITEAPPLFQAADNFFCFFFVVEILIRLGAFERKRNCLRDAWFVFDFFMAFSILMETWVLPIVVAIFANGGNYQQDTSLLKGLRLARLLRMARVLRLLRALPELMVVIKGLVVAARAVSCTLLLMLLIIYVFAITFRQLTNGTDLGKKSFTSVPVTMRYLLVQGTMPDLYDPVHSIWDEGVFYAITFIFFIFVTSITVMNMLVGIMVGVIDTVAAVEKEQAMVSFVKEHLMTLLMELQAEDTDKDGLVSKSEFQKLIQTPEAIRSFTAMGVDVINLVDLCDFLFSEEDAGIPFGDFMELILQLRGSNQATVKDVVDLRRFMTMEMSALGSMIVDSLASISGSNDATGFTFANSVSNKFNKVVKTTVKTNTAKNIFAKEDKLDKIKEDPEQKYTPDSPMAAKLGTPDIPLQEKLHESKSEDVRTGPSSELLTNVEDLEGALSETQVSDSGALESKDSQKRRKVKSRAAKTFKNHAGAFEVDAVKE